MSFRFKIVDVVFPVPAGRTGDNVWDDIEHNLPERAWEEQGVTGGWNESNEPGDALRKGEMMISFFENGLEFRQGALRLLADLGITHATEHVEWI